MKRPVGQLEEWEWIERYWSGQLSPEERLFFEKLMEEDARFAQEAESLRHGVQLLEAARLETHAQQTLRRLQQANRRSRQLTRRWITFGSMLSAACIALMIYLSYAPLILPTQENDLSILRDFRPQYQSDSTNNLSLLRKKAFDLFFEGQAFLAEGQSELAIQRFEQVLTYSGLRPYFREAAQWHLVLCYLKNNQRDKADELYTALGRPQEYDISTWERWKVWWHLRRLEWFDDRQPTVHQ